MVSPSSQLVQFRMIDVDLGKETSVDEMFSSLRDT